MKKIFRIASVLMLIFIGGLLEMFTEPTTHFTKVEMAVCALVAGVVVLGTILVGLIMEYTDLAGHYADAEKARNISESEVHRLTYTNRELRQNNQKLIIAINKLTKKPDDTGSTKN